MTQMFKNPKGNCASAAKRCPDIATWTTTAKSHCPSGSTACRPSGRRTWTAWLPRRVRPRRRRRHSPQLPPPRREARRCPNGSHRCPRRPRPNSVGRTRSSRSSRVTRGNERRESAHEWDLKQTLSTTIGGRCPGCCFLPGHGYYPKKAPFRDMASWFESELKTEC